MKSKLKDVNGIYEYDFTRQGEQSSIKLGDNSISVVAKQLDNSRFILFDNDKISSVYSLRHKDKVFVHLAGRTLQFDDITRDETSSKGTGSGGIEDLSVVAPMPGMVIKILVGEGEIVNRNQPLAIVEAMKMENEVRAMCDAKVLKVLTNPGQQVGFGQQLIELGPVESLEKVAEPNK